MLNKILVIDIFKFDLLFRRFVSKMVGHTWSWDGYKRLLDGLLGGVAADHGARSHLLAFSDPMELNTNYLKNIFFKK